MTIELTEEYLKELRIRMYPIGSGPLGVMSVCTQLIDAIANDKGFDVGQHTNPWPKEKSKNNKKVQIPLDFFSETIKLKS